MAIYRERFRPSEQSGGAPRHAGRQRLRRRHRCGGAAAVLLAAAGVRELAARAGRASCRRRSMISRRGSIATGARCWRMRCPVRWSAGRRRCGTGWRRSSRATGADELMVTAQIFRPRGPQALVRDPGGCRVPARVSVGDENRRLTLRYCTAPGDGAWDMEILWRKLAIYNRKNSLTIRFNSIPPCRLVNQDLTRFGDASRDFAAPQHLRDRISRLRYW